MGGRCHDLGSYTGLIGGADRNELLPWGSAVRAEAATILMRYVQTVAE